MRIVKFVRMIGRTWLPVALVATLGCGCSDSATGPDAPAADAGEQPEASSGDGAEDDAAPLEPPAQAGADASGGCALGAGARAPAPVSLVAWLVVVGAWRRRRRSAG